MTALITTPVFYALNQAYTQRLNINRPINEAPAKQGIVLEGSSGSGKTHAIYDWLFIYCQDNTRKKILCGRAKMTWTIGSIWEEFKEYLIEKKVPHKLNESKYTIKLLGNTIKFTGADDPQRFHGPRQDVFWANEAIEWNEKSFKQINQRTNEVFILDFNPSVTRHWIFNAIIPRPDTAYIHSTFRDNPLLPKGQRDEILAYEPTPENIANGTADDYNWQVYGLGVRATPEGVIFKNITWIKEFPDTSFFTNWGYGLDYGFTNDPTCLGLNGRVGMKLYGKPLVYRPKMVREHIEEEIKGLTRNIWADRQEARLNFELRKLGHPVKDVKKWPGSVKWGIDHLKRFELCIFDCEETRVEAERYKWRVVNGITLNEPVDRDNHFWDQLRYWAQHNIKVTERKGTRSTGNTRRKR